jgi:hypothetical protein
LASLRADGLVPLFKKEPDAIRDRMLTLADEVADRTGGRETGTWIF